MNGPRDFRSVLAERMRDFLAYHRALGKGRSINYRRMLRDSTIVPFW